MRPSTFGRRMEMIKQRGFSVCSLASLYERCVQGTLARHTLVVTIDDGWASIETGMIPILRRYQFPATLYLSTYFVSTRRPVFKVAAQYLYWKHGGQYPVSRDSVLFPYTGKRALGISTLLDLSKSLDSHIEDQFLRELFDYYSESYEVWIAEGKLMFLDEPAVKRLADAGLDIQLHTHRHRFAETDAAGAAREIADNRAFIERICSNPLEHFCYPRGEFTKMHVDCLREHGIKTATTTRNELVHLRDDPLCWPRIVDNEQVSDLEFEAELSGFLSVVRTCLAFARGGAPQ